jgi:tetratricopeptide (TPR) repeat protein
MARYFLLTLSALLLTLGPKVTQQDVVGRALDLASIGHFEESLKQQGIDALTVGAFIGSANRWLEAGSGEKNARYLTAATFALEEVWQSTKASTLNSADGWTVGVDWSGAVNADRRDWSNTKLTDETAQFPIVAWACDLMSRRVGANRADADWWLASIGILENARAWRALVGMRDDSRAAKPVGTSTAREIIQGHLNHARLKLAAHPRVALAEALAQSMIEFGSFEPSSRGRPSVLRTERPYPTEAVLQTAITRFDSLRNLDEGTAGEAEIWIGYVELRQKRWERALARFEHAKRAVAEDVFLSAVINYLSGWVNEQLGQTDASIPAYARANSDFPRVRNLSTLLAAQLYLRGDRGPAYLILREGLVAPEPQIDLITQFERGDARRVRTHLDRIRGENR